MAVINPELLRSKPQARPILIVEDNAMDLDFLLQALEENNVLNPLHICQDGEQALQFIDKHPTTHDPDLPVLVLMDLNLPRLDGAEVVRLARQNSIWKQIPFILLSTSHQDHDISRAYELGVNSYVVKPLDFGAFVTVIKHIKRYWLQTSEPPFPELDGRR